MKGWGAYSPPGPVTGGAVIETEPDAPGMPVRVEALTDQTQVTVSWTALATGAPQGGPGVSVTSYELQWVAGATGGTWATHSGVSPLSLVTQRTASPVTAGSEYRFRVRAKNLHGWGPVSSITYVKAATAPVQMLALTSALDAATGGVKIDFLAPYDSHETITSYTIEIAYGVGPSWAEELVSCDASSVTVMNNLHCIVPMSTLTGAPFNLIYGEAVVARARATNFYGDSPWSTPAGAVTIRTPPLQAN